MRVTEDKFGSAEESYQHHCDDKDKIVVLKFGSSVLKEPSSVKDVVTELYRYSRQGIKLVVVVSAFDGETDQLFREAEQFSVNATSRHLPRLIMTGEEKSAAMLALACDKTGLNVRIVSAREIGLAADGEVGDAHPNAVDTKALKNILTDFEAVIVPGFIGTSENGEPVLFGRGGSDLTAVFLANALGLKSVTFIKDVDGVFDRDPAEDTDGSAKRYDAISWQHAISTSDQLLQQKAVLLAEKKALPISVARLNSAKGTIVKDKTIAPNMVASDTSLSVGIAGLGVVGGGVAQRVAAENNHHFKFSSVLVSDRNKKRDVKLTSSNIFDDVDAFLNTGCDLVVDALSCGETGAVLTEKALERGMSVISANKQALAGQLAAFHQLAEKNGAKLLYSAAVGGGSPMVETVARARQQGNVIAIDAIVNGTVNFILTAMGDGLSFADAVKEAQDVGFAEADPTADLSGLDAKAKASILAYEAWGVEPNDAGFSAQALDEVLANDLVSQTGTWRQLTRISRKQSGDVTADVKFENVEEVPLFRSAANEANVLRATMDTGEIFTCRGRGAGRVATVESILADLGVILRGED